MTNDSICPLFSTTVYNLSIFLDLDDFLSFNPIFLGIQLFTPLPSPSAVLVGEPADASTPHDGAAVTRKPAPATDQLQARVTQLSATLVTKVR